jgi:hypothetical protein
VFFTNNEHLGICELQIVCFRVLYGVMLFSISLKKYARELESNIELRFVLLLLFLSLTIVKRIYHPP